MQKSKLNRGFQSFYGFGTHMWEEIVKDDMITFANELTYKLVLALFPFIIFLMSVIGLLGLDPALYVDQIGQFFPSGADKLVMSFVDEVIDIRAPVVVSVSLLITIISASSGFNSAIKGLNRAFGMFENRGYIKRRLLSLFLVTLFAATVILSVLVLVLGDWLAYWILGDLVYEIPGWLGIGRYLAATVVFLIMIMIIYKMSVNGPIKYRQLLPGGIFCSLIWVISTKLFNVYVNNFSKYSTVYGSIAGLFILMIWLNIMAVVLLLGGELNAALAHRKGRRK